MISSNMQKQKLNHSQLLLLLASTAYQQDFVSASELFFFLLHYSFLLQDNDINHNSCTLKTNHFLAPQGNGEKGARYLDPKYSRWISVDPALGEYIPQAPISDEARKHNHNLPGIGGVFNSVNLNLYHYAANNPVKYTDPDGKAGELANVLQEAKSAGPYFIVALLTIFAYELIVNPDLREEIADYISETCAAIDKANRDAYNYFRENIEHYMAAKAKARELTQDISDKKSTGSYTIYFASGKSYSGKGIVNRACTSAAFRSWDNLTMPVSIDWKPAANNDDALVDEYIRIQDR